MQSASSASVKVFWPTHDRDRLVSRLRERLPALETALPLRRVALFGSWATGHATAFSDVDLLVIYADPPRADAFQVVQRTVGLRGVEPHVYSEAEARALRLTLDRMTRHSIELLDRGAA